MHFEFSNYINHWWRTANITLVVLQTHGSLAPWHGGEGRWSWPAPYLRVGLPSGSVHVSLLLARAQEFLHQGGVVPLLQPLVLPMEGRKGEGEPGRAADESGLPERNPARLDKGAFWPLCSVSFSAFRRARILVGPAWGVRMVLAKKGGFRSCPARPGCRAPGQGGRPVCP